MKTKILSSLFLAVVLFSFFFGALLVNQAEAVPAFARKYKTSCSTCHYAFPKLNAFGKAFFNNGFRYPEGQDAEMTKEETVSLGSQAYKKVWPDAIWPTDMPGTAPLSVHSIGRFHYFESNSQSTFEIPHEFELFFSGTFDDKISYFGEVELEHSAELAYDFFVQYDFKPSFHVKLGSVGLQRAFPEHLRLTANHYNIVNLKNQSGTWRLRSGAKGGIEVWGVKHGAGGRGGLTYALVGGNGQNDADNFDVNKSKDFYGRLTYKLGGLGEAGGTSGQGSEQSAFYLDNSCRLGAFFYSGTASKGDDDDKFSVYGGDIDWWFNRLNVVAAAFQMKSDYLATSRTSLAYFAEANYVLYPWLVAYARYEYTDKDTDSDTVDASTSIIPAMVVMVRANVKCSLEYKVPLDNASKNTGGLAVQFNYAF